MDIEIGTVLEIQKSKLLTTKTVTVVGIRIFVGGDTMECRVTIRDLDGVESTAGAFHLARWVEIALS